jgi:hypothetical protein
MLQQGSDATSFDTVTGARGQGRLSDQHDDRHDRAIGDQRENGYP